MNIFVTAIGDASDPSCWSGIPFHFVEAAKELGINAVGIRIPISKINKRKYLWAANRAIFGLWPTGFQYSSVFLDRAESQIPKEVLRGNIVSFSQHFPRASTVKKAGGSISYYIDSTFKAMSTGRGLNLRLPADVVNRTVKLEKENYHMADRVIAMARWTADSVIHDCEVDSSKVYCVLPGANIQLPMEWIPPVPKIEKLGRERPFVLGFVGKDWKRKGLHIVCEVRNELCRRGWNVVVRAIGSAPATLANCTGIEFGGFIDKRTNPIGFIEFLGACDFGCLFSERECLGISTLEFLRLGIPVLGYDHEGIADTIPPDAGILFPYQTSPAQIADRLNLYLLRREQQLEYRRNSRIWSNLVTWKRCVTELQQIFEMRYVNNPVQPWMGLSSAKF